MKPVVLVGHAHHCPLHGAGKVVTGTTAFTSNGDRMGPTTGYEDDCLRFQATVGFPASGYYNF